MAGTSARRHRGSTTNKVKRYHDENNTVVWQEHQPAHGQGTRGNMSRIKEEEAHTQALSSPKKK